MRSTAIPVEDTTKRLEAITLLRLSRILNFTKHLVDINGRVPLPEPFQKKRMLPADNREALSTKLLQWFLHDGIIRGVTPEGDIFDHNIDVHLTQAFIKGITSIKICGIKR